MVVQPRHRGLAEYLLRHDIGIDEKALNETLHLIFDKQFRVAFSTGSNGVLWLEGKIAEVPVNISSRMRLFMALLEHIGQEFEYETANVVTSEDERLVLLQQMAPAEAAGQEFENLLEKFINLLAKYRSLAGML